MYSNSLFKNYAAVAVALKELGRLREEARETLVEIVKNAGKVMFVPAGDKALKEDDPDYEEELRSALEETSGCVEFSVADGLARHNGFVTSVEWDEEEQVVIVKGINIIMGRDGKNIPFKCNVFDVVNPEELLSFVDTFAE